MDPNKKTQQLERLIVELCENNDNLKDIYELTKFDIYGYALSILKNHIDIEDVIQDTYLKILNNADKYVPEGKPMAWILTITKNLCLMNLRTKRKSVSYDIVELDKYLSNKQLNIEERLALKSVLEILTKEERQIVMLHVISGFKHREIAEFLNVPLSTILSKYNRSLKKLKTKLGGD